MFEVVHSAATATVPAAATVVATITIATTAAVVFRVTVVLTTAICLCCSCWYCWWLWRLWRLLKSHHLHKCSDRHLYYSQREVLLFPLEDCC